MFNLCENAYSQFQNGYSAPSAAPEEENSTINFASALRIVDNVDSCLPEHTCHKPKATTNPACVLWLNTSPKRPSRHTCS